MIDIRVNETSNKNYLMSCLPDTVEYSLAISNMGDEEAQNVCINIDIDNCLSLIIDDSNSIIGIKCTQNNISLVIPSILPQKTIYIKYKAQFNQCCKDDYVQNIINIKYKDDMCSGYNFNVEGVNIPIIKIDVCTTKSADKVCVSKGDTLRYSVNIKNNSNVDITNVIFYDTLPAMLALKDNTIYINGVPAQVESLSNGVNLGTIPKNTILIIEFETIIPSNSLACIVCNRALVEYEYSVQYNSTIIKSIGESESNNICTKIISY
ncbi:DUF11 domain-containing protein [Clostridium sp.]|uniref:DUF11 domain-containing protein n=1 Tax=Clostridium sp. TaxID=1506 RepID=UPI003F402D01